MMKEWIVSKKKELLFWGVLAVIGIICIIRMLQPTREWTFGEDRLELVGEAIHFDANVINENAPGWYVDNSMEYGEVFAQTPALDLPAGSYDVTIRYQAGGNGAKYEFSSAVDTYKVMLGRIEQPLEEGRTSKTLSVNYTDTVKGFQVKTIYTGEGYLIINGIEIHQTRVMERMVLFTVFVAACCGLFWMKCMNEMVRKTAIWALGIALMATLPVMMPYLYKGDDLYFHLQRIEGIASGLKCGQFPVRIQPQWMNGYGYPVSIFYGEGILAIAGLLRLIGFPLQLTYKLYIFIINFCTWTIAFFCIRRVVKEDKIAILGGALYTLAPYRLMNLYLRAAVGEYTALMFLPLILVGAYEILLEAKENRKFSWLILAAGMTGIIQSHILTCEIVVLVLIAACLVCYRQMFVKDRFIDFMKAAGVTVSVNLFFLLPFLDYMRDDFYVNSERFGGPIQTSGAFLSQLFSFFPHGYGMETSVVDGLTEGAEKTFAVGWMFVLALILFLSEWKKNKLNKEISMRLARFCCIGAIVLLYMSTVWFPWNALYNRSELFALLSSRLQFAWRLLGTVALFLTVETCVVLKNWKRCKKREEVLALAGIIVGIAGISTGYFYTSMQEKADIVYIADAESISSFELVSGEYVPVGVDWSPEQMPEGKIWKSNLINVADYYKNGTNYELSCANLSDQEQILELPMTYYRGYVAEDSQTGGDILISSGDNGRIRLTLAGNYTGTIQVKFKEPVAWRISEVISLFSVVGVACYFFRERRSNRRKCRRNEE